MIRPQPHPVHGGRGVDPLRDFSFSTNPFGPPPAWQDWLNAASLARYPGATLDEVAKVLVARHGAQGATFVPAAGTTELIYRWASTCLHAEATVLVIAPTFNEYARAARLYGAHVSEIQGYALNGGLETRAVHNAIQEHAPDFVWLCNPNNPTGHTWPQDALAQIEYACTQTGSRLCIDAAYSELCKTSPGYSGGAALTLYSPTKTYGVPGIRFGYGFAESGLARLLNATAPPWLLGAPALGFAHWLGTPAAETFIAETRDQLLQETDRLLASLTALDITAYPTTTPFALSPVGHAEQLLREAGKDGFALRTCDDFDLPNMIRLSVRHPDSNDMLLQWLSRNPAAAAHWRSAMDIRDHMA